MLVVYIEFWLYFGVVLPPPSNRRDDSYPSPGNTDAQPGQLSEGHFAGARIAVGITPTFLRVRVLGCRSSCAFCVACARTAARSWHPIIHRGRPMLVHQHSGESHGHWPTTCTETPQSARSRQAARRIRAHGPTPDQGRRPFGVAHRQVTEDFRRVPAHIPGRAPSRLSVDALVVVCRSMSLMYSEMGLLIMRNRSISFQVICPYGPY